MTLPSILAGDGFRTTRFERRVVVVAVLTSLSDETLIDSSSRFDTRIDDFSLRLFRPRLWPSSGSSEASLSTTGAMLTAAVDDVDAAVVGAVVVAFVLCRVVRRSGGVSASSSSSSASAFDLFGTGGHVAFLGLDEARPILRNSGPEQEEI